MSKVVSCSWDDCGWQDELVMDLFLELNIPATFFPTADNFRNKSRICVEKYKCFEVGNHTFSHQDLTQLSPEDAAEELLSANHVLEDVLQKPVVSFAYPYGRWSQQVEMLVRDHGFVYARGVGDVQGPCFDRWRMYAFEYPNRWFWDAYGANKIFVFFGHPHNIRIPEIRDLLRRMIDNDDKFVTHLELVRDLVGWPSLALQKFNQWPIRSHRHIF